MIQWHPRFVTGDVTLLLIATLTALLVAWPGIALFCCGILRRKLEELSPIPLPVLAIMSIVWCLWAFSLAFAPGPGTVPTRSDSNPIPRSMQEMLDQAENDKDETASHGRGGFFGGHNHLFFDGLSSASSIEGPLFPSRRPFHQVPQLQILAFQMTLFVIAPTSLLILMIGRFRPGRIVLFAVLWGTVVYSPVIHWVWGDGWLESLGVVDSSGGLVHVAIGFSALACALAFRIRSSSMGVPHSDDHGESNSIDSTLTTLGLIGFWVATALINGALTMHADGRAVAAFMNTHLAACAGVVAGPATHRIVGGRSDRLIACLGGFTGLVSVSCSAAFILPQTALITGAVAAGVCCVMIQLLQVRQWGREGVLVFIIQGIAGSLGCVLAGVFSTTSVAGRRWDGRMIEGAIEGNINQIGLQCVGLAAAAALGFVTTLVLIPVISLFSNPIRETVASDELRTK